MFMQRSLAAALWLVAAAGAYAVAVWCADDAQTGKLHPWVLVVVFWTAAAVSVAIHHLSRYLAGQLALTPEALRRSRRHVAHAPHLLGLCQGFLSRGLELLESRLPHFVVGRDLVRRTWRQHEAAAGPQSAAQRSHVAEIGS